MKNNTTDGKSMTVSFSTERGSFLLVKVPEGALGFELNKEYGCLIYTEFVSPSGITNTIKLPEGTYTIIGLVDELTEKQWKGVVDKSLTIDDYSNADEWHYANYKDGLFMKETATESGHSLLSSLEVYSKNPYGIVPPKQVYASSPEAQSHYDKTVNKEAIENWRRANERTGRWLLLKKEG